MWPKDDALRHHALLVKDTEKGRQELETTLSLFHLFLMIMSSQNKE